jgi:glutathione S-transferase
MKLYYMPGACSLAPHIALREAGLPFDLERVERSKQTQSGADYLAINAKGAVPALGLDDGQVLTEAATILQYIADKAPAKTLAPAAGTQERYRSGSTTSPPKFIRGSANFSIRRCRTITRAR